jgi:hypothetical protein
MRKTTLLSIGVVRTLSRLVALPLLLLSLSSFSFGQGSSIFGQVVSPGPPTGTGGPAAFATVRICPFSSSGLPCTPLAPLFSDPTLTTPTANPSTTDQWGNYSLFVATGTYIIQVTPVAGVTYSYLAFANGSATVSSVGLSLPPAIFSVTGSPVTSNGVLTGTLINQSANSVLAAPSGSVGIPIFRLLTPLDIPWATPGTIGSTTPNTGAFTTVAIGGGPPLTSSNQTGTGNLVLSIGSTLAAKSLNNIQYCDQFTGATADVKLLAAQSALPAAGGIVDCRGFGATTQTLGTGIVIGSVNKTVTVLSDRATEWRIGFTGGGDAIQIAEGSAWVAEGISTRGSGFHVLATANIEAVFSNQDKSGFAAHFYLKGVTVVADPGATISKGVYFIQSMFGDSGIEEVEASGFSNTCGILLTNNHSTGAGFGNFHLRNNWINGSSVVGAVPLCVWEDGVGGGLMAGIDVIGGLYEHAGNGLANMWIKGSPQNALQGVTLDTRYTEISSATGTGILIDGTSGVLVTNLKFGNGGTESADCIQIKNTSGGIPLGHMFVNLTNFNGCTVNIINDFVNGATITDARVPLYVMPGIQAGHSISYTTDPFATWPLNIVNVQRGITADGGGFKHSRTTVGCATAAPAGSVCDSTLTWTTPFTDANYTPVCSGLGVTSGNPVQVGIGSKSATGLVFRTGALTASVAQYTTISCIAAHD